MGGAKKGPETVTLTLIDNPTHRGHSFCVPFRTLGEVAPDQPQLTRRAVPELLAFAASEHGCRVIVREGTRGDVIDNDRGKQVVHSLPRGALGSRGTAVASATQWGAFEVTASALRTFYSGASGIQLRDGFANAGRFAAFMLEGQPHVMIVDRSIVGESGASAIHVYPADLERDCTPNWFAQPSSRRLLTATATAFGPAALFATDRIDEVDVSVWGRGGESLRHTVSLGWNQHYECAVGGGARIMVVSRDPIGLVVRTLASDVRSELNPVPIKPTTGWTVGAVRCCYANGPFAVAHSELRDDERAAFVTVFDDGVLRTLRLGIPSVDAIAVEGKDLAVAALVPGYSAPILAVQRLLTNGSRSRRYVYLLQPPACDDANERRRVLTDVAELLAQSLSGGSPRNVVIHAHGEDEHVGYFAVSGPDADHDLAVGVMVRSDGSGIASVRIGHGSAPEPLSLNFVAAVREMLTGDDDGDPATTRIELPNVVTNLESVVAAVGALRASRGT